MSAVSWAVYAPTHRKENWKSPDINWTKVKLKVKRLQMRIAKAVRQKKYRKMRSLQWLLTHSMSAKLLAVRRVTSNKGKNTPGIDGVVWRTSGQKENAVNLLVRRGYKAQRLRRVYIRKSSGKLRPLGIPTMQDRAMQALHAFSLIPVAETTADPNSYGFRQRRSCADAIGQCFISLSGRNRSRWILEADIASCFDEINHQWLLENIPMDRKILAQWLNAGYVDNGRLYPTLKGTPQGGIISPVLMNMTLDGLEREIKRSVPIYFPGTGTRNGINVVRYADDFIITGKRKEMLEDTVLPVVKSFLRIRGLRLSEEKTRIVEIEQGFTFLGQLVRKVPNGKMLIRPTLKAVKGLQANVKRIIKAHSGEDTASMIRRLNPVIRGWANYHRHVCSSQIFTKFDTWLFWTIKRWLHKRHPNKGKKWLMKNYYRTRKGNKWTFHAKEKLNNGAINYIDLYNASWTNIVRHIKVKALANPYNPKWNEYFDKRLLQRFRTLPATGSKP